MLQRAKINTYFTTLLASFLERLRAAPEGEGSVLDDSLIAYEEAATREERPQHERAP